MVKTKQKSQISNKTNNNIRQLKPPQYKTFKLHKKIKHSGGVIPSAFILLKNSTLHLLKYKKLFFGIVLIYFVLSVLLVRGLGVTLGIPELKASIEELLQGQGGSLATGFTLYGLLLANAGSVANEAGGAYQSMLLVIISLVIIWALRQTFAGEKVSVKDAFYKSMYPLIPFLLVLCVISLQFIPLAIAGFLMNVVFNGLAITVLEQVSWSIIIGLLVLLSMYMLMSSIFALYIVSLPEVRPLQALRSARELVRYRRWAVARKLIFLPFSLLVIAAVIIIPIILYITPLTEGIFYTLSMVALVIVHGYLYTMYREML